MKTLRRFACLLLVTIFIQIVDGPFSVESADKQFLAGALAHAATQLAGEAPHDPIDNPFYSHGSIDETVTDLADMPRHSIPLQTLQRDVQSTPAPQRFFSAAVIPLYRPPLIRLS
ncbi:MAG: hypothetical protein JWL62_2174 [Hyphomicrobiales bacterium]|nr:hypothetical protein [Hyphomicrobiales bacterium]